MERGANAEVGYVPGPDYVEDNKESLFNIEMDENSELWLIQLRNDEFSELDGQKLSLELDGDGPLCTVEGNSGKSYNMVNYPSDAVDFPVFLSSPSGPKIAGKISRHVSLVRYPDPKELVALESDKKSPMPTSSETFNQFSTPSKSQKTPNSQSRSRSTYSGKRSSVSEVIDGSRHSKRSNADSSRYSNQSTQESGRGRSDITFSESSELSHRKKKKKTTSDA